MIIVAIKNGQAVLGRGSKKNSKGNKTILTKIVNDLVNSILLVDCFNKIFQITCPTATDNIKKNSRLSKLVS